MERGNENPENSNSSQEIVLSNSDLLIKILLEWVIPCVVGILITLGMAFLMLWQLVVLGVITTGLISKKEQIGIIMGLTASILSWLIYFLIQNALNSSLLVFDKLAFILFGNANQGIILLITYFIISIILGLFGGMLGFNLKKYIIEKRNENKQMVKKKN